MNIDDNNKNTNIINCPRCEEKLLINTKVCSKCGFALDSESEVLDNIRFGMNSATTTIVIDEDIKKISQNNTKQMKVVQKINTVLFFLVGIVSILLLFLPIYAANNNIWERLERFERGYGYPHVSTNLSVNGFSNVISIISGIIKCISNHEVYDAISVVMIIYELSTVVMVLVVASLGVWLLILAIKDFFYNKHFISKYRKLLGVNLTLLLLLMFAFGCYGAYVIVCITVFVAAFILLYISGVLSKEKQFLPRNLTHKSICFALLVVLLIFSSVGLVNLNVTVGSDLFNSIPLKDGAISTPNIFACHGLFLELAQFIQRASGDNYYTTTAFLANLTCLIFHVAYLAFISMAIVSLLKSLSNQSVRFPLGYIIVSTISFYAFSFGAIIFNQLVNEAAHYNYASSLPAGLIFTTDKVFTLSVRMIISMSLNLPVCIYCGIAKGICLKRTYYK